MSDVLRSRKLPWILFVLALAAALSMGFLWQRAEGREHRRAEVTAVTQRFLTALTNFSGDTIDADVQEIKAFAVGSFADQVDQFFDDTTTQALKDANAVSKGTVQSIFVESLSGGSANVFGVVSESVTNKSSTGPRSEILRIDMEMIETKDGWKVDSVKILQSPGETPFGGLPGG